MGFAEALAIDLDAHRQVQHAVLPGGAQRVRRHRNGREAGRRLALVEAEALGEFARNQSAQGHVVEQDHQRDQIGSVGGIGAHGYILGNHGDLGLKVDLMGLVDRDDGVLRPEHHVRPALIHQRFVFIARRNRLPTPLVDQPRVIAVDGGIRPLVGPGQRGHALGGVEGVGSGPLGGVEFLAAAHEPRRHRLPTIQQGLQRCRAGPGGCPPQTRGAHQHQLAVTRAIPARRHAQWQSKLRHASPPGAVAKPRLSSVQRSRAARASRT